MNPDYFFLIYAASIALAAYLSQRHCNKWWAEKRRELEEEERKQRRDAALRHLEGSRH